MRGRRRELTQPEFDAILAKHNDATPAYLADVDFVASRLDIARVGNLAGAILRGARLDEPFRFPENIDLSRVNLSQASLVDADLTSTRRLSGANLASARLNGAKLAGCRCGNVDFSRAILRSADLNSADLSNAKLNHADLRHADLKNAKLDHADLSWANLSRVREFQLDQCRTEGTLFDGHAREPWLELKRAFSGLNLALHIALLAAFIAPYALKAVVYTIVAEYGQIATAARCLAHSCIDVPLIFIVSGWTGENPALTFALLSMSAIYNALRTVITVRVERLMRREAETGRTPPLKWHRNWLTDRRHFLASKLRRIFYVLRHSTEQTPPEQWDLARPPWDTVRFLDLSRALLSKLGWATLAIFIVNVIYWLTLTVPVPAR